MLCVARVRTHMYGQGAHCINHVMVVDLIKDPTTKRVCGAVCVDRLTGFYFFSFLYISCLHTGKQWTIRAKSVINATGPFMDTIRIMDNAKARPLCIPSAGVHIVLPGYYRCANTSASDLSYVVRRARACSILQPATAASCSSCRGRR
jgi:glycerol-3-phosphate dehydrogenase